MVHQAPYHWRIWCLALRAPATRRSSGLRFLGCQSSIAGKHHQLLSPCGCRDVQRGIRACGSEWIPITVATHRLKSASLLRRKNVDGEPDLSSEATEIGGRVMNGFATQVKLHHTYHTPSTGQTLTPGLCTSVSSTLLRVSFSNSLIESPSTYQNLRLLFSSPLHKRSSFNLHFKQRGHHRQSLTPFPRPSPLPWISRSPCKHAPASA